MNAIRMRSLKKAVKASGQAPASVVVAEIYDALPMEARRRVFYYLAAQIEHCSEGKLVEFPPQAVFE